MTMLQRLEQDVMGEEVAGFSIFNKALCSCRFDAGGQELGASFSGHGDMEDNGLQF
jgi:hypothetical protein